jgi:hypothetical protein
MECGWNANFVGHVVSAADESSPQGRAFTIGHPVIIEDLREANSLVPPSFYGDHRIINGAEFPPEKSSRSLLQSANISVQEIS